MNQNWQSYGGVIDQQSYGGVIDQSANMILI
jgi:hypothetical protein